MSDAPIVREPSGVANAAVIWMHGLGADGHDFEPVVGELPQAVTAHTRFVFPHAPMQPVTINGGTVMRAWYDIFEMELGRKVDEQGVLASVRIATDLVDEQVAGGIASHRIVLAGFSQGGVIALHTGLRYRERLAGIMALSTYLPASEALAKQRATSNALIPIMLAHGSQDPMIPLALSDNARETLRRMGYTVQCHTYAMPHSVCAEEIRDIGCWLETVLTPTSE